MNKLLFRKKAFKHQRNSHLGRMLEAQSPSIAWLTTIVVLVAVIIFLCLGEYTRKSQVGEYSVPDKGVINVYTMQIGVIAENKVYEGQLVKKGDPLIILSTEQSSLNYTKSPVKVIKQLKRQKKNLKDKLLKLKNIETNKNKSINSRLADLNSELLLLNNKISIQKKSEGSQDLNRIKIRLAKKINTLKLELLNIPLERKKQSTPIEREVRILKDEIKVKSAQLLIITAPETGVISVIFVKSGQRVLPSKTLISIVPIRTRPENI